MVEPINNRDTNKLLSEDAVSRIKAFAENEALEWVDVHGDIWDLLKAYSDTVRENERLREALEYIAGSLRNSENDKTLMAIRDVCDTALEQPNKD